MALLPETEEEFDTFLAEKIPAWKESGVRSLQIKFQPPKCHLMNTASRHGFFFHHAHNDRNYVLMILWTDSRMACRITAFAHHYIGIGGIVLKQNAEDPSLIELALIKENRSDQPEKWKLPGGFMDPGERIQEAAIREVKEETGIHADFLGVMGIRETASYKYGASDLYFGAILFNKSTQIAIEDVREVKQAQWVPLRAITHNETEPQLPEYPLYPTAYAYIKQVQQQVETFTSGTTSCATLEDYLRQSNLCKPAEEPQQEEGTGTSGKPPRFNFYTYGGANKDY